MENNVEIEYRSAKDCNAMCCNVKGISDHKRAVHIAYPTHDPVSQHSSKPIFK